MHSTPVYALINDVPALREAEQRRLLSERFNVTEWFVIGKDGDFDSLFKLFREGRLWAVCYAALMGCQKGGKETRVESMIATKVAAHRRGSEFIELSGRTTGKDWRSMKRDGEAMCGRWAQGRKSVENAKRGAKPLVLKPDERRIAREHWFSTEHATVGDAVKAIKKALGKRAPARTMCYKFFGSPYTGRGR